MARIRLPCVPRLAYTPSTSADTPSTSPVTQLYTQADTLPNMPGYVRRSSMFAKGAGCPSRDDRASLCTLSKIASASRSQSFDGAMRSQDEIQARKAAILENMGHPFLVRHRMSSFASLSSSCHRSLVFAVQYVGYAQELLSMLMSLHPRRLHFSRRKNGQIKSLVWTAQPHSSKSVDAAHAPVTPYQVGRSQAQRALCSD